MKRKIVLALIVLILCPVVFSALSAVFPKRYTAISRVSVDQKVRALDAGNPFGAIDDLLNSGSASTPQSQVDIITGSNVLQAAIGEVAPNFPNDFPDRETQDAKIQKILNRLRVDASRESNVISIAVTTENPQLSAALANALAKAYLEETKAMAEAGGATALTVLNKQIEATTKKLADVDGKVAGFKQQLGVSDPLVAANSESSTVSALELRRSSIDGELNGARAELAESEAILKTIKPTMELAEGDQLNPQLTEVEAQLARANAELARQRAKYLDEHPNVQEALRQVRAWEAEKASLQGKQQIRVRTDRGPNPNYTQQVQTVAQLRGRVKNLEDQSVEVNTALNASKERLKQYATLEKELASLNREKTVYENNYLQLVQRKDATEAIGRARSVNANIVSTAFDPSQPSFPDTRLFFLMGIGLGIVLAALIIMPKAPVEAYATTLGSDRSALKGESSARLKGDAGASALESGQSNEPKS